MNKGLGRLYIPDERDEKFLMKSLLPKKAPKRDWKYWNAQAWFGDQGDTPQCVAYAWMHWLHDGGITQNHKQAPVIDLASLYKTAQRLDMWPGENYDGTSVRAGAKVLQAAGYIDSYYWAWRGQEVFDTILTVSPVVIGVNWYTGMFYPTKKESIIKISGRVEGGHAVEVNGINLKTGLARIKQSWGENHGRGGFVYISLDDLDRLIRENGEACLAKEIRKVV